MLTVWNNLAEVDKAVFFSEKVSGLMASRDMHCPLVEELFAVAGVEVVEFFGEREVGIPVTSIHISVAFSDGKNEANDEKEAQRRRHLEVNWGESANYRVLYDGISWVFIFSRDVFFLENHVEHTFCLERPELSQSRLAKCESLRVALNDLD